MSIEETLSAYKSAREKEAEDAQRKAKEEQERQHANARHVENHLRVVVLPILEDAEQKIKLGGYKARVEIISQKAPAGPAEITFALRMRLNTGPESTYTLEYEGQFQSSTIRMRNTLPRRVNRVDAPEQSLPCEDFSAEIVKGQVEEFVAGAFRV